MLHIGLRGASCVLLVLLVWGISGQKDGPQMGWEEDVVARGHRPALPRADKLVTVAKAAKPESSASKAKGALGPPKVKGGTFVCSWPNACNLPMEFPAQKDALLKLYQATNGDKWAGMPKGYEWKKDAPPRDICLKWAGVECDPWGRVVKLKLAKYGLKGTIPNEISALDSLSLLDLSENMISGTLPNLDFAKNMTYLYLQRNLFTGTISQTVAQPKLRHFEISQNFFSGALPDEFAKLRQLTYFDISSNKLTKLPDMQESLKALTGTELNRNCDLTQNHFACPVPKALQYPAPCGAMCGEWIDSIYT